MIRTTRAKLFVLYVASTVLIVSAVVIDTLYEVNEHYATLFYERAELATNELSNRAHKLLELGLKPNEFYGFSQLCNEVIENTPGIRHIGLVDKDGHYLYQSDIKGNDESVQNDFIDITSSKPLYITRPLKYSSHDLGYRISASIDKLAIQEQLISLLLKILVSGFVLAVIGSLLFVLSMNYGFGRPINALLKHIKDAHKGGVVNLPKNLAQRDDEIGLVANAFDRMMNDIAATQKHLENQKKSLEETVKLRTHELEETNNQLKHLAHTDMLTQLPNRLAFNKMLENNYSNALRHKYNMAVLLIDLNGFKLINDAHGHDAGDYTLQVIAERLKNSFRQGDTFSRLGGDEFSMIIGYYKSNEDLVLVAEKITSMVSQPIIWNKVSLSVSASIGIATMESILVKQPDELLRMADIAMYESKKSGEPYHISSK